ncbi:DUF4907 domain-containing protein [Aureivirga marina]|uniref:DUF4907 domain-containing protein n=1 Tax=Aureivirga marina TaxID=1182451 RepID=UPI0018CB6106|nr:DUF4907 domain-containing protein [Aureivirga marina]
MKNNFHYIFFVFFLSFFVISCTENKVDLDSLNIEIIKNSYGFGYEIKQQSKILIKQDFIPAIQNRKRFCSFEDANKIASLVVKRIKNKKNPRITLQDLQELKIELNCKK